MLWGLRYRCPHSKTPASAANTPGAWPNLDKRSSMDKPTCTIAGCDKTQFCRTWCTTHYCRWQRHGDPLKVTRTPPMAPDATEKFCPRCEIAKPLSSFGERKETKNRASLKGYCLECEGAYHTDYTATDVGREARRKASLKWSKNNREYRLLRNYGITEADYDRMALEQGGRCAICATDDPGGGNEFWSVDHCHDSGRVRGLLCNKCNMALGLMGDDPVRLTSAIAYLGG